MDDIILKLDGAGKRYPHAVALDDVALELRRGEIQAVTGGNRCGKTTLAGIISGAVKPDRGRIRLDGHDVIFAEHIDALHAGIALVSQDISLVQPMSIAENIWIGREADFSKAGFISPKARAKASEELMRGYGIELRPGTAVQELTLAQMRAVELMRAVSYSPSVLVLDEPTAGFDEKESAFLRGIISRLRGEGMSVVIMTHEPEELYGLADRITVLRDGRSQGTFEKSALAPKELIKLVVGDEKPGEYPVEARQPGPARLQCREVRSDFGARGASFEARGGEILGVFGLFGAGRMQTLRAVFGLDKKTGGSVLIDGREVNTSAPSKTIKNGVAMIMPGKAKLGFFRGISARWNAGLAYMAGGKKLKFLSLDLERIDASKGGSVAKRISDLSDTGRKRVIVGRSMAKTPRVLISCEPTQGVNFRTWQEVYKHLDQIAAEGVAVVISTSDIDEVIGMSDRIIVLRDGLVAAELRRGEATRESVMAAAFGF